MADNINLPNLVSHLQVNLANTSGAIADAARQGSSMGAALGGGIQRELRDAVSNLPDVQIDGNTSDLDRDLARVRGDLDQLANRRIGVDISIADALRELERLEPHLERLSATHPNIHVQATTRGALRQLAQLRQAARQVDDTDVDINVRADTDEAERNMRRVRDALDRVVGIIPTLGKLAIPFAAAGVAAGAAVPLVAGLVAALSNIAPAAAVGTSAMLSLQLATNTVKLAMVGVEDAITAALDPEGAEAYAEAIKKLSPEARKFTDAIREMAPELDTFRRQVQDRVFAGFSTELTKTAKSVLPALKTALLDTSDSLNAMAKGVAESARDLSDRGIFGKALDSATASLESMEQVPGRVTTSLGLLAAASGPSLERIAKKADEVSARILESLTQSFESGELELSIDGAVDLFEQMGRIVRNIFKGLGHIIGGVTGEAGSLFFILEELSGAFERLTASEEFQSILQQLVATAEDLVQNVLPLLRVAFEELAPVIEELGPPVRDFINKVGPELIPLLKELGPILKDLAIIFREQLPFAIEVVKAAIQALTFVLGIVHWVLSTLVIPLVRKAAQVLNSDFVKALASASREASAKIGTIAAKFEQFRSAVATVMWNAAGKLWDFVGAVGRFAQGIANSMGEVIDIFWEIPGAIRAAVGDLGNLLWNAGWRLIGGLIAGVRARISELRSVLSQITSLIPDWKGPAERDATLLTPNGKLLMEGLIAGIDATTGQLRSRLGEITSSLPSMLSIPGLTGGALSVAGPGLLPAAAPAPAGGHTFHLYGGDATPDGILRAVSWNALVGGTSG